MTKEQRASGRGGRTGRGGLLRGYLSWKEHDLDLRK